MATTRDDRAVDECRSVITNTLKNAPGRSLTYIDYNPADQPGYHSELTKVFAADVPNPEDSLRQTLAQMQRSGEITREAVTKRPWKANRKIYPAQLEVTIKLV